MPIMGGFEMLETLEKEDIALNIPKIIFTTESLRDKDHGQKMKKHGKDLGVKTWL
jgi:CheY-like chemotaxis protein